MQSPQNVSGHAPNHVDPHIEQNRHLAREFAHDASARWVLRVDTAVRRVAGWFVRN
jgi:hypothetical protein